MIAGIVVSLIVLLIIIVAGVYYYKTKYAKGGAIRLEDDSEKGQTRRERRNRFQRKGKEPSAARADATGGDLSLLSPARVVEEDINVSAGFDEDADDTDDGTK